MIGAPVFDGGQTTIEKIVERLLHIAGDEQVVVGPLVSLPSDGTASEIFLFRLATCNKDKQFRFDEVVTDELGRSCIIMELTRVTPRVVHIMEDELDMIKLCEILWPGQLVSSIRKELEAERKSDRHRTHSK